MTRIDQRTPGQNFPEVFQEVHHHSTATPLEVGSFPNTRHNSDIQPDHPTLPPSLDRVRLTATDKDVIDLHLHPLPLSFQISTRRTFRES